MILESLLSLRVISVMDRGVPNRECITLRADEYINLGQFGLMVGYRGASDQGAFPFRDNLFWFGDGVINKGDWIFVYTGAGNPIKTRAQDDTCDIFIVHWGRPTTMFANTNTVPILFRADAVDVGNIPVDLPQLPLMLSK